MNFGNNLVKGWKIQEHCIKIVLRQFENIDLRLSLPIISKIKHRDHRAISALVTEAWWKASEGVLADRGAPFKAKKLYYFEVTEPFTHPDVILDITQYWEIRKKALSVSRVKRPLWENSLKQLKD
jgi:LmbE family N-acetylglucosaminyl deacetylase